MIRSCRTIEVQRWRVTKVRSQRSNTDEEQPTRKTPAESARCRATAYITISRRYRARRQSLSICLNECNQRQAQSTTKMQLRRGTSKTAHQRTAPNCEYVTSACDVEPPKRGRREAVPSGSMARMTRGSAPAAPITPNPKAPNCIEP